MTKKTYRIMGKYQGKSEKIDTAKGEQTAYYLVGEYSMAYGRQWEVWAEDKDGNKLE